MQRKRFSPLPFAAASVVLMVIPSAVTQRARVTGLAAFIPFRLLADRSHEAAERAWDKIHPGAESDELRKKAQYYGDLLVETKNKNLELTQQLESVTGLRSVVGDKSYKILLSNVVINLDSSGFRQSLVINVGSRHGVERGQLVLYHNHVIGRIAEAGPWMAKVLLVTDSGFRAGAVSIPKAYSEGVTFSRRDIGVFEGNGSDTGSLKWIAGEAPLAEGNYVITTDDPANDVPKGLILGRVTSVARGRGPYPKVEVTPIIDPRGLEFVLVLRKTE